MVKEVLIIGTPIHSYTESVCNAFKKNGFKSNFLIYRIPNIYLKNIPVLSKLYFFWYRKIYPISFFKHCLAHAPQNGLLVLFGINYMTNSQLQTLKKEKNLRIVLWFIDSIYTFPWFKENIEVSDLTLCYNKTEADFLSDMGKKAFFFPMAYDNSYYFPIENSEKQYDLYFVGTLSRRLDYLEEMLRRLSPLKLRIKIDGPVSWVKRIKIRKNYPLLSRYMTGQGVNHKQINTCYNDAHVCLSIQPVQADTGFSTRVYEICGAGALQLTNGQKELLGTLFKINTDLLHFGSMDELISQVMYIMTEKNSPVIKGISGSGFRRALKYHTFNERVAQLLKYVNY